MDRSGGEAWLYHLPGLLDRIREHGAHSVARNLEVDLGGVLYHHRGARVPGHDATFVWHEDTFELEVDAVGPRSAWAVFDAGRSWDFYLAKAPADAPYLAWMTDGEFDAEEVADFPDKGSAVNAGRFSFGLYLHAPATWSDLETRARESDAPFFVHRPSGRTLVPEGDATAYESVVPGELLPERAGESPPDYLGLVEAHVSID